MDDETKQALAVALPKVSAWVKGAVRRDRANAYGLDAPWILPRLGGDLKDLGLMPPDYFGPGFHIADGVITELPFPVDPRECDGCTFSPDWWPRTWGGLRAYVAAIFHDRWYRFMESMARAWGWTVARVRRLGDIIFGNILHAFVKLLRGASRIRGEIACRTYYRAVRAFGGVGHAAYKRLEGARTVAVAVAGSLLLGGCAGCSIPSAWEDPDAEVQIPAHSYSNLLTGATWKYEPPFGGNDGAGCAGNDGAAEGRNDGAGRAGNEEGAE